ncbi:SDR family NAD(P)-dependent oxidoreductase [Membranihabitans marinus]|uniref:SDR family NAD(P)-dependent oxidoreductase n=1 Tax=Membranihabitans marinus TaxID=1227546 RepID=UPI001F1BF68B|nr:SDR family oxidoreductase [Membranihabitans marinus]
MEKDNKVVIITGASGGVGIALAQALSESGYNLALQYYKHPIPHTIKLNPASIMMSYRVNLESDVEIKNFLTKCIKDFGKIDVLINNAGVYLKAAWHHPNSWMDVWNKTININLKAAALLSSLCFLEFKKRGSGIILNVSSRAGQRGDDIEYMAYAASKSGMYGLTKTMARAGAKHNIYCYSISPGWINTAMARQKIEIDGLQSVIDEQEIPAIMEVEDMIPMIQLLISGQAAYATGNNFNINGGSYIV